MRRKRQALTEEECRKILDEQTSGVLSVVNPDGSPYGVPLSYALSNGAIYFHCALQGQKIEAFRHNSAASFCVIGQDQIVPEEFTTYFRSVIVFGNIRLIEDDAEKRAALTALAQKYSPQVAHDLQRAEIDKGISHLWIAKLSPLSITGKEAIELKRLK